MLEMPIEVLNLSVRATNVLHRMNIHEVKQLLDTPMEQIAEQRNIGVKTLSEIEAVVAKIFEMDINSDEIGDFAVAFADSNTSQRVFSDEHLEELSYHSVLELELSNRATNTLLKIDCSTMDVLVKMSESDIRNLKGLGTKTFDEIIHGRERWLEENGFFQDESCLNEKIPELEKKFYQEIAKKIKVIVPIHWKKLRDIVSESIEIEKWLCETIDEECIRKILALKQFDDNIRYLFLKYAPKGIIKGSELEYELAKLDLEFRTGILRERILDGSVCCEQDGYYILNRPHAMEYLQKEYSASDDRNGHIILQRLSGDNLQIIGDMYDLTRERVRQILVKTAKKMSLMYEDYFSEPYKHFKFSKEEFCNAFPTCGETGYEYLFIKYKKGNVSITPENVKSYTGLFGERMNTFWGEEAIRRDKKTVSKMEMVYRVLLSNSDKSMSMEMFEKEYYDYIERRNYPRERLTINQRTVTNHLRNAKHIVFDKNNYVRYCEADPNLIWNEIDFTQYRDLVISTELIYKDYIELMDELDIRDGYELFYVIKSSIENWDTSLFEINCRRVPVVVIGNGNEEHQAVQFLKEISPIDFQAYYEAYEERFGLRKETAQGNPVISGALSKYYADGMYAIDVPAIDERDVVLFKEKLAIKKFWFLDELEREFATICVHSSEDAFNTAAFKRIGYSLNMGYAYNDEYSSVVNYFDDKIFSTDIVDLRELDRRLVNLSIFGSALYKKKMDLDYIEVAPKILMSMSQIERAYGITVKDIKEMQNWVLKCEEKYFNAHSLWRNFIEEGYAEQLQNNEWMATCIFRQQETVASLQVAGGIILCKESSELNLGSICKWLVEKNGRMTIQSLTTLFNEIFATKLSTGKIAEKMRAYGLWDTLVTDSFDEYIDNLVIDTESNFNEEDLFSEEFF